MVQTLLNGTHCKVDARLNSSMIQEDADSQTAAKKIINGGVIQLKSFTSSPDQSTISLSPVISNNEMEVKNMDELNQEQKITDKDDKKPPNPQQMKRDTSQTSNDKAIRQTTDRKPYRNTAHSTYNSPTYSRSLQRGLVPTPTVAGYPWATNHLNWPGYYVANQRPQVSPLVYGYQPAYIQYASHHHVLNQHPNNNVTQTTNSSNTNVYSGGEYDLQDGEKLSKTNLYIRGLTITTTDDDLVNMCKMYGNITSTKAILHKDTNQCKGYGFVDFDNPTSAQRAVASLQRQGIQAQMAKQQEQDPTNLYLSNLPKTLDEQNLQLLLQPYGNVISTRILRDSNGTSKGVGFARMDAKEICETIIDKLNGQYLPGSLHPLLVKFADGGPKKTKSEKAWRSQEDSYLSYEVRSPVSTMPSQPNARVTPVVQSQMMSPTGVSWGMQQQPYTVVNQQGVPVSPAETVSPMQQNLPHLTNQLTQMHIHNAGNQYIVPNAYPTPAPAHQNSWQLSQQTPIQDPSVIMTATEVESNYSPQLIQSSGPPQQHHMPHVVSSEVYTDEPQTRVYYARK